MRLSRQRQRGVIEQSGAQGAAPGHKSREAAPAREGASLKGGLGEDRERNALRGCSASAGPPWALAAVPRALAQFSSSGNAVARSARCPCSGATRRPLLSMELEDEEAEQALMRLYNEAYLQRMGRPQEFGV